MAENNRLLTKEELSRFAVGYMDFPTDSNGDLDMEHPKFQKGEIRKEWIEIIKAQDLKTRHDTLREVAEWFENKLPDYCRPDWFPQLAELIAKLKLGEMPE